MAGRRRQRLLALLDEGLGSEGAERLCSVCADVTDMSGAGIMLMSDELPHGTLCCTDDVSKLIEDVQFAVGEGPGIDACARDRPVLEPDLADPVRPRWSGFADRAVEAGVCAVFAFPLDLGHVHLGALDLYRDRPGPLSDEHHADALVLADLVTRAVLVMQADAPPGRLAAELERGADLRLVVHQAAGMVAAQLDESVAQALVRLRARAFSNEVALDDLAADVVARRLRFDGDEGRWP